jgi:hypothetical protein
MLDVRFSNQGCATYEGLRRQVGPELGTYNTAVACDSISKSMAGCTKKVHTMWSGDLAPDNPDLGAPDGALSPVDVGYALTGIPLRGCGVVDALKLEQRSSGVGVALSSLVGNVLSPKSSCVSQLFHMRYYVCATP